MSYETGTASSRTDLFTKIRLFATANGWTDVSGAWPISQGVCHVNWGEFPESLSGHTNDHTNHSGVQVTKELNGVTLGTSQPGVAPGNWWEMPGSVMGSSGDTDAVLVWDAGANGPTNGDEAYVSYHLFEGDGAPHYIHCAMQLTSQIWQHLSFGNINQFGLTHGGVAYATGAAQPPFANGSGTGVGSCNHSGLGHYGFAIGGCVDTSPNARRNTQIFVVDALPAGWTGNGTVMADRACGQWLTTTVANNYNIATGAGQMLYPLWQSKAIPVSGDFPLYPIPCFIGKETGSASTNEFVYVGDYPNVAFCQMGTVAAGTEFSFGGDTWKVFPYLRQTPVSLYNTALEVTSGTMGIAYLKNT